MLKNKNYYLKLIQILSAVIAIVGITAIAFHAGNYFAKERATNLKQVTAVAGLRA